MCIKTVVVPQTMRAILLSSFIDEEIDEQN